MREQYNTDQALCRILDGYEVFYFDVDSPTGVAKKMKRLADIEGWQYFNPDVEMDISRCMCCIDRLRSQYIADVCFLPTSAI